MMVAERYGIFGPYLGWNCQALRVPVPYVIGAPSYNRQHLKNQNCQCFVYS